MYEKFQSTRPMRGATPHRGYLCCPNFFFNPRAPCGARQWMLVAFLSICMFQSTRPMRGATRCCLEQAAAAVVSIHAPHAGRDFMSCGANTSF